MHNGFERQASKDCGQSQGLLAKRLQISRTLISCGLFDEAVFTRPLGAGDFDTAIGIFITKLRAQQANPSSPTPEPLPLMSLPSAPLHWSGAVTGGLARWCKGNGSATALQGGRKKLGVHLLFRTIPQNGSVQMPRSRLLCVYFKK